MNRRLLMATLMAGAMALPTLAPAQQGPGAGKGAGAGSGMMQQKFTRERLYGSPLMTLEERQEHQRQMWNAKTAQERQKIRDEHRVRITERAKQQNYRIDQGQDDVFSVPAVQGDG